MFVRSLFGFVLLALMVGFLGRPGLAHNGNMDSTFLHDAVVPEPAQCLVSRIYNLIRPAESKVVQSCWQDCFAETDCHMAVVTKRISGAQQCLLVNCLNHGKHSLPRDPSAEITVYPKSTIDDEQRANYQKGAYGLSDEKFRCKVLFESPRFFYNSSSSRCERIVAGCGSNNKMFETLESCETFCNGKFLCYLPVDYGENPPIRLSHNTDTTGKPEDSTPNKFFYNVSSGSCEGFHFRGSLSNGNIFSTVEECENLCGDVKDRCFDFTKYSSCQSESPKFFYNSTSYRCERILCGCGTKNKYAFDTLDGCEALCDEKFRCYRPVEYGLTPLMRFSTNTDIRGKPKDTTVNFYFYNVSSGSCEGFHFRGSGSNGNIFWTVKECESLCGDVKDTTAAVPTEGIGIFSVVGVVFGIMVLLACVFCAVMICKRGSSTKLKPA